MSEILGVLFGLMLGLMGISHISNNLREQQHLQDNIATAMQQQDWVQGVSDYTTTNMVTLQSTATATSPVVITLSTLQAAGVTLPTGFSGTDPYNQTWVAEVLQPTAGHLQVLAYTTGGTAVSDKDLGAIARNAAGVGGMIPANDSGAYPGGAANAYGAFGAWQIATTNYTNVAGGHPASLLNFSNGSLTSNYLYRNAVPGQPQLNQMNTDLGMNGHNITSVGQLQTANGNGVQVGSSYLYGDSTNSAIRQNGSLYVQNQAGTAAAPVIAGDVTAYGNVAATGTITAGGNAGVGGNLSVTGNGQVNGTLTTGGQITSGGILQVNGTATAGTACSSNGQMAQGPSGPLFCQSGVWRAPAQFACNTNGCYERLQDGLIIQTGFVASSASGFTSWNYPIPFGSAILAVSATVASRTDVSAPYIAQVGATTLGDIPFRATDINGNNVVYGVSLIAIGY
jgi:hypothetical protein